MSTGNKKKNIREHARSGGFFFLCITCLLRSFLSRPVWVHIGVMSIMPSTALLFRLVRKSTLDGVALSKSWPWFLLSRWRGRGISQVTWTVLACLLSPSVERIWSGSTPTVHMQEVWLQQREEEWGTLVGLNQTYTIPGIFLLCNRRFDGFLLVAMKLNLDPSSQWNPNVHFKN